MTKTELLDRFARDGEERILLARALDRLSLAEQRGVPAHTEFLTPEQQSVLADLLRACGAPRHFFFGGFEGAERQLCVFLPDWQERDGWLSDPDCPVAALRCTFPRDAQLAHRDILGSLMGLGITRETLGDLLLYDGGCDVIALRSALPILLTQWEGAGRCRFTPQSVALADLRSEPPAPRLVQDTVAALRLDAVTAAAFSLSRSRAGELIASGRVLLDHRPCLKPDRAVGEGSSITCRGMGKCVVKEIPGLSRKGRTRIVLELYR